MHQRVAVSKGTGDAEDGRGDEDLDKAVAVRGRTKSVSYLQDLIFFKM